MASVVLYKGYTIIQQNGEYKSVIAVQEVTIKNKDNFISKLQTDIILRENINTAREAQLEMLRNEVDNLTNNLGDDANDQAPKSLKEVLRRLKND